MKFEYFNFQKESKVIRILSYLEIQTKTNDHLRLRSTYNDNKFNRLKRHISRDSQNAYSINKTLHLTSTLQRTSTHGFEISHNGNHELKVPLRQFLQKIYDKLYKLLTEL